MTARTFQVPERNNALYLKEAELVRGLAESKSRIDQWDMLDAFLDYCSGEKDKAEAGADRDIGYANQCQRRIDRYAPLYDGLNKMLQEHAGYRKQLDEAHERFGKSGGV